jgi:hypothetical protein
MLYIGDKDARPWLRLEIQYYADTWLFVQTATFVVDGEKRSTNSGGWERDNDTHIYEWLDIGIDQKLAQDIANGEEVILRLKGKHYQKDRTLTKAEKTAMKNVLKAYAELGGN